jgi:hypothetical protein
MTNSLHFGKKSGVGGRCFYSITDDGDSVYIGILKQDASGDGHWYWVPAGNFMYGVGTLTEITDQIKELNSGYEPKSEVIQPAIRHLDLDD